MKMCI